MNGQRQKEGNRINAREPGPGDGVSIIRLASFYQLTMNARKGTTGDKKNERERTTPFYRVLPTPRLCFLQFAGHGNMVFSCKSIPS